MTITNISILKSANTITLSADIHFNGQKAENVYFATSLENENFLFVDASPFLAAFFLPCMKKGEDIFIDGSVSKALFANIKKIADLVVGWNIGLSKISVSAKEIKEDKLKPVFTACFFSAGVDSFYTYLKNKHAITHLLFVHGFDVPLENTDLFDQMRTKFLELAEKEKKTLLTVETNVAQVIEKRLVWDFGHGGALAAVGLFLRSNLKKVFISSAVRFNELFPYGTHPDLDKLWSSEHLVFSHEGSEYNRLEKIVHSIAKSDIALAFLHVCSQNRKGKYNCSRCYKCLMTMIELICAEGFDKALTFDHPIDLDAVEGMYYDYKLLYNLQGEANLEMLRKQRREPVLQQAIEESLERSKNPPLTKKISQIIAQFDQKYNDRRLYRLVFQMNKKQDRNILFKLLIRGGFLK